MSGKLQVYFRAAICNSTFFTELLLLSLNINLFILCLHYVFVLFHLCILNAISLLFMIIKLETYLDKFPTFNL